jgi:hypothetical protein
MICATFIRGNGRINAVHAIRTQTLAALAASKTAFLEFLADFRTTKSLVSF